MAAGLPVISLDGKGNRDIIQHKINGYIFQDQNAEKFGNQIIELISNMDLYQKISKNAKQFAQNYDIKNYTEKLIKIYNEITSSVN
tara:strand:- start:2600 stop:2857 length:258 start_codon:yes stop_codon:yes gene_type:complete